jgi:hypothetical protein
MFVPVMMGPVDRPSRPPSERLGFYAGANTLESPGKAGQAGHCKTNSRLSDMLHTLLGMAASEPKRTFAAATKSQILLCGCLVNSA